MTTNIVINPCNRCCGNKWIDIKLKDLSGKHMLKVLHTIICPDCKGKGYITQQDIDNFYNSIR